MRLDKICVNTYTTTHRQASFPPSTKKRRHLCSRFSPSPLFKVSAASRAKQMLSSTPRTWKAATTAPERKYPDASRAIELSRFGRTVADNTARKR